MRLLHQLPANTYDDDLGLAPRDGPQAVLSMMSDIAEVALASNVFLLHPNEVEFVGGHPKLVLSPVRPDRSLSSAPEVTGSGPVPSTLTYSVGAIAALATLGSMDHPPESQELHGAWVTALTERLSLRWAALPGAAPSIDLIARCLAYNAPDRPHPNRLLEEITRLRATFRPVPGPEPVPTPATSAPSAPERRGPSSLSGGAPALILSGHPLVPYAMITVVLASLALAVALCTFGAVMGQFAEQAGEPPAAGAAGAAGAAQAADPPFVTREPVVAPASLFDRFDRRSDRGAAPAPLAAPAPVVEEAPLMEPPAVKRTGRAPEPRPEPVRPPEPAPAAPVTGPRPERPKAAPGSDLKDPWDR